MKYSDKLLYQIVQNGFGGIASGWHLSIWAKNKKLVDITNGNMSLCFSIYDGKVVKPASARWSGTIIRTGVADNFIMEYQPNTDIYITGTVGRNVNIPNFWWPWRVQRLPKRYDINVSEPKLIIGMTQTIDFFQIQSA